MSYFFCQPEGAEEHHHPSLHQDCLGFFLLRVESEETDAQLYWKDTVFLEVHLTETGKVLTTFYFLQREEEEVLQEGMERSNKDDAPVEEQHISKQFNNNKGSYLEN